MWVFCDFMDNRHWRDLKTGSFSPKFWRFPISSLKIFPFVSRFAVIMRVHNIYKIRSLSKFNTISSCIFTLLLPPHIWYWIPLLSLCRDNKPIFRPQGAATGHLITYHCVQLCQTARRQLCANRSCWRCRHLGTVRKWEMLPARWRVVLISSVIQTITAR